MGNRILLVDDELPVLKSLQRLLRQDFDISIAESGQAALEILADQEIDIIISDMRMPYMDGHQLLRKVKELYPATTRLILSGYADEKEITQTMLDGSSRMYLMKPWDSLLLVKTIQQLLDVREKLRNYDLLEIISKIEGLSALPRIYHKLVGLINEDADVTRIAAVIEEDPAIASQLLRVANSAFYGIKTGSVSHAVIYLGLTAVKSIVLSTNLGGTKQESGMTAINRDLLWRHAGRTNHLVGELHRAVMGETVPTTAASAGLLHNIGIMAMLGQFPDKYEHMDAVLKMQPTVSLSEMEQELIGVTHQEVGGYLLEWWDLPHQIVESAMFHHDPFNESVNDRRLVSIVHVASHYAAQEVFDGMNGFLDERVFSLLHTTREECERIIHAK